MIRLLTKIYVIVVTAPIHIGALSDFPTKIEITPFQLEIRSLYSSPEPEKVSIDLMSITEDHISSFIKSNKSDIWNGFQSVSLFPEEEDMISNINRHRQLQDKGTRNLRSSVNFKVFYSGSILMTSDTDNLPSQKDVEIIVLEAFIGQGKLDYIRSVRKKSDDILLSYTNYAKVWLPSESDNKSSSLSSDKLFLTIAIVAAIAIVLSIVVALYYNCCRHDDETDVATIRSKDLLDIRVASTRSMSLSPTNKDKPSSLRDMLSPKVNKVISFCAEGSFDVIGYKSNGLNLNTPFETNISMISKANNDHHIVDIPREILKASKGSAAAKLSKGILSDHNKQQYERHSTRSSHSHRTRK